MLGGPAREALLPPSPATSTPCHSHTHIAYLHVPSRPGNRRHPQRWRRRWRRDEGLSLCIHTRCRNAPFNHRLPLAHFDSPNPLTTTYSLLYLLSLAHPTSCLIFSSSVFGIHHSPCSDHLNPARPRHPHPPPVPTLRTPAFPRAPRLAGTPPLATTSRNPKSGTARRHLSARMCSLWRRCAAPSSTRSQYFL